MTTVTAIEPASFEWVRYRHLSFSLAVRAGDGFWLSGHAASEYDAESGRVVVRGGVREQTELAYTKVERVLAGAGLGWADVASVREYVCGPAVGEGATIDAVRRSRFGSAAPPVSTIVIDRLLRERAAIEVQVTARTGAAAPDLAQGVPALPLERGATAADQAASAGRALARRLAASPTPHVLGVLLFAAPEAGDPGALVDAVRAETGSTATVVPVSALHAQGAAVALQATATAYPAERLEADPEAGVTAARAGRYLLLAGGPPGPVADASEAARRVYGEMTRLLEDAQLVETVEFVGPGALPTYRGVGDVRKELLATPYPASVGCVRADSAGLLTVAALAIRPSSAL